MSSDAIVLSPRQQQIAALIAEGFTNREVAEALDLTQSTIEQHITRILMKLGGNNRQHIRAWWALHGWQHDDT